MPIFDETPQVVFEVVEDGEVVYRDAITYATMAELRNDNTSERQAKFQERYDNWVVIKNTPGGPSDIPEEE